MGDSAALREPGGFRLGGPPCLRMRDLPPLGLWCRARMGLQCPVGPPGAAGAGGGRYPAAGADDGS